jgi:hypothetical protein
MGIKRQTTSSSLFKFHPPTSRRRRRIPHKDSILFYRFCAADVSTGGHSLF